MSTVTFSEPVARLLTPSRPSAGHRHRAKKLALVTPKGMDYTRSPYFTRDAVIDTFKETQFNFENHRRFTPHLQELFSADRARLMRRIDRQCDQMTEKVTARQLYDVAIIGSGPHGTAIAADLREKYPSVKTIIIEAGKKLGGQWRSYGPNPVFMMNSRVRRANRLLPNVPRTAGNINPLGMYAPLELSDVVMGNYAWNTDMGDICAVNAYLSANMIMVDTRVLTIPLSGEMTVLCGQVRRVVRARLIVDATGIGQSSALGTFSRETGYFNTASFYSHMAGGGTPLETFKDQKVVVIGGGDSALTCLEALIGNLPSQSYGAIGVGRCRPREIQWMGAPADSAGLVDRCLRSRYKNGIVQALPKYVGDQGAVITPDIRKVKRLSMYQSASIVRTEFASVRTDFVIDCTNQKNVKKPRRTPDWQPDYRVGPNGPALPKSIQEQVQLLRIGANYVALWARMGQTDKVAMKIGKQLTGK